MDPILYRITLDLAKSGVQHVLSGFKVGDTGRRIEIRLTNDGNPYDIPLGTAARIKATYPSGAKFDDLCEINGNVIVYNVSEGLLRESGEVHAEIQIGDENGDTFSTSEIMLLVYPSEFEDNAVPEDQFNSIIQAIAAATGKAVENASVNENGNLIVTLADGTEINAGFVKGEKGDKGDQGDIGPIGPAGPKGDSTPPDHNLVANALKGTASGNPIRFDDVSPLEHEMAVGVKSKNLIPNVYEFIGETGEKTVIGVTCTVQEDGRISMKGTTTAIQQLNLCRMKLPKGTYYISNSSLGVSSTAVVVWNTDTNTAISDYSRAFTLAEDTSIRIYIMVGATGLVFDTTFYVQLEEGATKTAYTPYVDVNGAQVEVCGKNLFGDFPKIAEECGWAYDGEYYGGDAGVLFETYNRASENSLYKGFKPNTQYTISCIGHTGSGSATATGISFLFVYDDGTYTSTGYLTTDSATDVSIEATSTAGKTVARLCASTGSAPNSYLKNVQLEESTVATEYEEYNGKIYTADENGKVEGVTSLYPTTTLIADNGAVISAEYNKDTNKVIEKLQQKIAALSAAIVNN